MFFSVIVPIYNVEKYLKRCIDSVLDQTCKDFELILVDDGSSDNCPQICDSFAAQNPNIKVIHKKNGGLVSARQAGIQIASGEYVFHLDGDDALLPCALERSKRIILETNADIVSFSYKQFHNGETKDVINNIVPVGLYNKENIEKEIYPHILCDKNMQHFFYFVWGRAIRRTLITKHQLNISTKISLGEDISCMVPCYLDAESLYMDDTPVYLYTIRDDSLSTSFNTKQLSQLSEVIKGFYNITLEKPKDFEKQVARYSCFMCFAILAAAAEGGHFKYLTEIKNLILNSNSNDLIKRAEFENITIKTKIGMALMKKEYIKMAFYFLYFVAKIRSILRKGE